ncbi:RadC family protein [Faecalibacter rhinopitheci]|uniref:DNA repair protein RadC n=1 Tax=Faecalibacter rhinopitheci TaxID=2779678 RepID=A0A8J7KD75_9FLAO|nr:DNA repair protein RadC [Faecalibacter rhinopitheci]MBF0597001.1 DNA repair protein RadC [Faecalibacter rhinopitheci]
MENYNQEKQSIKNWNEDDRPREKLSLKGRSSLSDAELLAIIMGSGNREESAVELAKRILNSAHNNWNELARYSILDLCKFKGVGEAKAISIITALEIGRRRTSQEVLDRVKINSSNDAAQILQQQIGDLPIEEFWVMFLNQGNKIIRTEQISRGGITQTSVDIRVIFKRSIELMATALILSHNHPSGNIIASEADKSLTKKIIEGAKYLDIQILDHIIVSQKDYFSFADEGLI